MEGAGEDLMPEPNTRREFLRLAAGAALAAAATGAACGSGGGAAKPDRPPNGKGSARPAGDRTLRIAQLSHFVPTYDQWLDQEYSKRWGEDHGVQVVIDHFAYEELPARADAEVAAHGPHDIFAFASPPPSFEDQVIDHSEIVQEVETKLGKLTPLVDRCIFNPKTKKYFAFADFWTANPTHYRVDLWNQVEPRLSPRSWDDILRAAPVLKAMGHPVGIGFSSNPDSNVSLFSLLHAFGASVQDEAGDVAINSPATVQAVKMGAAIFQAGMTDEVFLWDSPSNNRFLASGQGAMIVNAISAIRAVEDQNPELAEKIALVPLPAGPTGSLGPPSLMGLNVIWKFSGNQETAKQFLVDRALNYRDAFVRSGFYNLPAFPGAIPDLVELVGNDPRAKPSDKYALLAGATQWSTNLGHPGHANAAMDEVFNQFLVPKMFAAAARREMTADEAVKAAEAQMRPIFDKWRERGKI
jgi:multiple sugar transport system substrate-binding protein